jgi:hypothetical protein
MEARRIEAEAERTARARDAAARVERLLVTLEVPPVDEAARARLARSLDRHGAPHVILLIRTIIESEGNAAALIEPVLSAVSSVMVFHPEWANRGLAWIEAFDNVPLMPLLQTMVDLDLFRPTTIGRYLFLVLRRRLAKVFEPPKVTTVKAAAKDLHPQTQARRRPQGHGVDNPDDAPLNPQAPSTCPHEICGKIPLCSHSFFVRQEASPRFPAITY